METKHTPDNILAFPCVSGKSTEEGSYLQQGMNLRDYFAAKAMAALITTCSNGSRSHVHDYKEGVALAYVWADAMLEERSKQP